MKNTQTFHIIFAHCILFVFKCIRALSPLRCVSAQRFSVFKQIFNDASSHQQHRGGCAQYRRRLLWGAPNDTSSCWPPLNVSSWFFDVSFVAVSVVVVATSRRAPGRIERLSAFRAMAVAELWELRSGKKTNYQNFGVYKIQSETAKVIFSTSFILFAKTLFSASWIF